MRYEQTENLLKQQLISVTDLDCTIYDLQLDGIRRLEDAAEVAKIAVQNLIEEGYTIVRDERGVEYVTNA